MKGSSKVNLGAGGEAESDLVTLRPRQETAEWGVSIVERTGPSRSVGLECRLWQGTSATWVLSTLFGVTLGLAPLGLQFVLQLVLPKLSGFWPVVLGQAFLGSFVLGMFLLVLELTGVDHQHGFAVLGHPGFRHFVRLCVHPSGKVEGFVIGKDDPLGDGAPVLVDRFVWD